jgi:hypothetical protein
LVRTLEMEQVRDISNWLDVGEENVDRLIILFWT